MMVITMMHVYRKTPAKPRKNIQSYVRSAPTLRAVQYQRIGSMLRGARARSRDVGDVAAGSADTIPSVYSQQLIPNTGPIQFRVPVLNEIINIYFSNKLQLPESFFRHRFARLLRRMQKEKRLKKPYNSRPVQQIVNRIFQKNMIVVSELEKVVNMKDRRSIYKNVLDAQTKVKNADKNKFIKAIKESEKLVDKSAADSSNLKKVFGSKASIAKTRYGLIKGALGSMKANLNAKVTTDYNLDAREIGLGGWAHFGTKRVHFELGIVKVKNLKKTMITVIHEAAHLAHANINDYGYYGTDGFEGLSETKKMNNAAHYEEIPRRHEKITSYQGCVFTPGKKCKPGKAPKPPSYRDKVNRKASEYFRKVWDRAVDVFEFLRKIRTKVLRGNAAAFGNNKAAILKLSRLLELTVHKQKAAHANVTQLDIALAEGVARATAIIGSYVKKIKKVGCWLSTPLNKCKRRLIRKAVRKYGALLSSYKKDMRLIRYFYKGYKKGNNF